jgi:predicted ATP-dependent Lon-type protease
VLEQGGRNMISAEPLPPGSIYTASVATDGTVGMYHVEVSVASGSGKLRTAGGVSGATKESIGRAFSYVLAKKGRALDCARAGRIRSARRSDRLDEQSRLWGSYTFGRRLENPSNGHPRTI